MMTNATLVNAKNLIEASSYSGASIDLVKIGDKFQIIKVFRGDIQRDRKSIIKQIEFDSTERLKSVPLEILDDTGHHMSVSMPFVSGMVGSDYGKFSNFETKDFMKEVLNEYFQQLFNNSKDKFLPNEELISKIQSVMDAAKANPCISVSTINIMNRHALEITNQLNSVRLIYPSSNCHGDLTLSNMIYSTSHDCIFLIDFLSVFLDSFLLDYVKILQDLEFGWSARYEPPQLKLKHAIFGESLLDELWRPPEKYNETITCLNLVNLMRIAPYIKDSITAEWLSLTLGKLL